VAASTRNPPQVALRLACGGPARSRLEPSVPLRLCGWRQVVSQQQVRPWNRLWSSTATSATGVVRPRRSTTEGRCTGSALNSRRPRCATRQALELVRAIASSWDEAHALVGLGRCALAAGHATRICYGLLSSGRGWSRFRCGSPYDRLASALEVERGGTRVSEGDRRNWAAGAGAVSDRIRELAWRRRELAERSHAPVAVVPEIQRPASLFFSDILLSAPAITSGTRPFSHEAAMQFRRITDATDPGSARHTANPVGPRGKSLIRRFTGRCGCR